MYYILVYDIMLDKEENGSKVLRNVFKICKKYLHHIQNSVFEGELSKSQILNLKSELKEYLREQKDSVIIFEQTSNKWLKKEFLGIKEDKTSNML